MTSPRRRILPRLEAPAAAPQQPPVLNDDLLEGILLRVGSPADLARAAATCRSFRRIIADQSFHRRYRALHPPLLLGIFCNGIQPAAAPHPNAPAARSLAASADGFFFDYLPGNRWQLSDVRDGRVLLESLPADVGGVSFPEIAVCDPVHRRFRLLPPIPQDLIAHAKVQDNMTSVFEAFLVPSGNQEETSFKVIARTHCEAKLVVFVFSSDSDLWSVGRSTRWADLGMPTPADFVLGWTQYEHGSFYWKVQHWRVNKLLKLDIERMELSTVNLPPGNNEREVVIVEAEEGKVVMFSLPRYTAFMYYLTSMKSKREEENEWLLESTIPLPCRCNIVGKFEGYIFLLGVQPDQGIMKAVCFSLEIKTFKIERINSIDIFYIHVHPYFGYPPFMSPRRIEVD